MRRFTLIALVVAIAGLGLWMNASASSFAISQIQPAQVVAGKEPFLLRVEGTGFAPGSKVHLVRADLGIDEELYTLRSSNSLLYGAIESEHIAAVGSAQITVKLGEQETDPVTLTIIPLEVVLTPEVQTVPVNGAGSLTVTIAEPQVEDRTIELESSSPDVAGVPAVVIIPALSTSANVVVSAGVSGGTAVITATVDAMRGGATGTAEVIVENPTPVLDTLDPAVAVAGRPNLTLLVNGSDFAGTAAVAWNGLELDTTFVNSGQLAALVPAAFLAEPGSAIVTVSNPEPGGGVSNGVEFTVVPPTIVLWPDPLMMLVDSADSMTVSIDAIQAEDRLVTLESLNPSIASVPASVTIAAGDSSAVFTINSGNAGSTTVVAALPAALGAESATATVYVGNPEPEIVSLDPGSAIAGTPDLALTVHGSGFVASSAVQWNGSGLATTFVGSDQLTAVVPAALLANPGSATITVANPEPGGGVSNGVPFTIGAPEITLAPDPLAMVANSSETMTVMIDAPQAANRLVTLVSENPSLASVPASVTLPAGETSAGFTVTSGATTGSTTITATLPAGLGGHQATAVVVVVSSDPIITGLNPDTAVAGRPDLTVTVSGGGFVDESLVEWNGAPLATSFVGSSQLTAVVPAALLAEPGSATVTVVNPDPGGTSNGVTFTVTAPTITLTPDPLTMAIDSTAAMNVTINAAQAADRVVMLESLNPAVASVPASVTIVAGNTSAGFTISSGANTGSTTVSATLPASLGGNSATATVNVENPAPAITTIVPNAAVAGDPAFTLTVNGSGFIPGSVVRWNGADRPTTFVSSSQLTADIPAADIALAGTAEVRVFNLGPGGGLSNAATFTINNPLPAIASLAPDSAMAGGPAFTLTVHGDNFVAGSVVRWNGANRPTTFVSSSELAAAIPASDIAAGGTASVTVFNAAPGGGLSNALTFTINNPLPEITSLSPDTAIAGRPNLTLTVNGASFVGSSQVTWNGSPLATTFVNSNQLTAVAPAASLNAPGSANVAVANPGPGGGSSAELDFTIVALGISLAENPTTVVVNGSGTMTVTIDQQQAADRLVTLEVGDPALLAAPAVVLFPAGSLSAGFSVSSVGGAGETTVTATLPAAQGGQSAPATVEIVEVAVAGLTAENSSPTTLGEITYLIASVTAGSNVTFEWDLGDGSSGSGPVVMHTYAAAGSYTAVVTASNNINSLTTTTLVTITNLPPIANAGPDQIRQVNELVTLDGTGSTDPDGHYPLAFGWTQIEGPAVTLDDPESAQPTFTTLPAAAVFTFSLVVTDSYGLAGEPDTVTITVPDQPALSAELSAHPALVHVGETVTFTLTLTNNGNVVLQNLASTTTVGGNFSLPAALGVGESASRQVTYVVQQADLPGPLTNLVTVTAATPENEPVVASVTASVAIQQYFVYLPFVVKAPPDVQAPDLVVQSLTVDAAGVTVVIANAGNQAVTTPFWVDVYFDPDPAPASANQIWQMLSEEGLVWGIDASALPLLPGATMTLVIGDAHFMPLHSNFSGTIAAGTAVYAQVDSAHNNQEHGAVLEIHEITGGAYNNVYGPVIAAGTFHFGAEIPSGTAVAPPPDTALPRRPDR
jgi:uncharacterized repeat protein (TIGR01451 family)